MSPTPREWRPKEWSPRLECWKSKAKGYSPSCPPLPPPVLPLASPKPSWTDRRKKESGCRLPVWLSASSGPACRREEGVELDNPPASCLIRKWCLSVSPVVVFGSSSSPATNPVSPLLKSLGPRKEEIVKAALGARPLLQTKLPETLAPPPRLLLRWSCSLGCSSDSELGRGSEVKLRSLLSGLSSAFSSSSWHRGSAGSLPSACEVTSLVSSVGSGELSGSRLITTYEEKTGSFLNSGASLVLKVGCDLLTSDTGAKNSRKEKWHC